MSANASAMDDSNTEGNVAERSGGGAGANDDLDTEANVLERSGGAPQPNDDSDTDGAVEERSGGDPLPNYVADVDTVPVVDTGVSITQRCRARLRWVQGKDFPGLNKDDWVCEDGHCERPVCAAYRAYKIAASALEQSSRELQSQQELIDRLSSQPSESESSEDQRTVLDVQKQMLDLQKQRLDLQKQMLVDKKERLVDKKERLVDKSTVLLKEHTTMKEILINRKASGNKTDHKTAYTNKSQIEEEVQEQDAAVAAAGNGGSQASPSRMFDAMRNGTKKYPIPASLDDIFTKLGIGRNDALKAELEEFYSYCDSLFYQSEESTHTYMSQEYAKDIQKTVNAIVGWTPGQKILQTSRFCRPSSQAQETRGVHPILLALMWKINSVLKGTAHFTSEQFLPKQLEKSKRWMDALWSKAAQHFLSSANGNLIGKSCEFKPISRSGVAYKKLVEDGINQELGHNLQVLWDSCFQFCGGLGKDGETSGIVLTMISASLLVSKLSGVGTQDVKLKILVSDNVPLFSEATTKILAKGVNFGSLGLKFDSNQPMQPGFLALVDYISNEGTPPQDTDQDTVINLSLASDDSSISAETVEYLGSGAFASVYDCKLSGGTGDGETRALLKMSKDRDSTELHRELKALQALTHEAIPKLFKNALVTVTVKARCERKYVKGLLLNLAIGKSLQQKPEIVSVQQVLTAVENVLDYAHEQGWYHLDVQPSNIIVVDNGDETCRYILIDWGTAVNETTKLTSFHGTPPFSHPEMLLVKKEKDDRWSGPVPSAALDKFSLAMTLAYIEHKGLPWSGFHKRVVTDDMLEDRYKKAVQLIKKSLLDQPSKDKVLGWIPEPEKQSPSSQPQTPRVGGTKRGPGKQFGWPKTKYLHPASK